MKKKQKNNMLKKLITIVLIIAMVMFGNISFAEEHEAFNMVLKGILGVIGGLIGIAMLPIIIVAIEIVTAGFLLLSVFSTGISNFQILTPASLFFNKIPITNPMLFVSPDKAMEAGLSEFAINVAVWFRVMMLITVAILFLVLLYLSIKAMISDKSSTIADMKTMLFDWGMSVMLLGVLGIIIVGSIYLNNAIISALSKSLGELVSFDEIIGKMFMNTLVFFNPILQVASIILLGKLLLLTAEFLFAYIKRMLNIAFLIIIAPLITVTYSIDKLGDKKAQALSTWNKEFLGKIFIQPVHAILFYVTMSIVSSIVNPNASQGVGAEMLGDLGFSPLHFIVALLAFDFIKDIEKLLMGMFDLGKGTSIKEGSGIAKAILGSQVVNYVGKKAANKASSYVKDHIKYGRLNKDDDEGKKELEGNTEENEKAEQAKIDEKEKEQQEEQFEPSADDMDLEDVETVDNTQMIDQPDVDVEDSAEEVDAEEQPQSVKDIDPPKLNKDSKAQRTLKKAAGAYAGLFKAAYQNKWAFGGMIAGAGVMGGVSGALTGYGVGSSVDTYANTRANFKKSRKEQLYTYNDGVNDRAKDAAKLASTYSALTGQNLDPDTKEGKAALRAFFNTLNEADSKENILNDFKKSIDDYKKHLMDDKNYTLLEANTAAQQLLNGLHSGTVNLNTLDDNERKVAVSSVFKDAIEQKEVFEKEFALIEGDYNDVADRLFVASDDPDYREIFNKYQAISQVRKLGSGANSTSSLSRKEKEIVTKFRKKIDNLTDDKKKELDKLEKDAQDKIDRYIKEYGSKEKIERTIKERYKDGFELNDIIKDQEQKFNEYNNAIDALNKKIAEEYNDNLEPGEEKVELDETSTYAALEGYTKVKPDDNFKNIVKDEVFDKRLQLDAKKEYAQESKEAINHINKAIEQSRNEDIIKKRRDEVTNTKTKYNELFGSKEKSKKTIEEFTKTTGKDAKELLDIKADMEIELEKQLNEYLKDIQKLDGVTDVDIKNYNRAKRNETVVSSKAFDDTYTEEKSKGATSGNYDKQYTKDFKEKHIPTPAGTAPSDKQLSVDEYMKVKEDSILGAGNTNNNNNN